MSAIFMCCCLPIPVTVACSFVLEKRNERLHKCKSPCFYYAPISSCALLDRRHKGHILSSSLVSYLYCITAKVELSHSILSSHAPPSALTWRQLFSFCRSKYLFCTFVHFNISVSFRVPLTIVILLYSFSCTLETQIFGSDIFNLVSHT